MAALRVIFQVRDRLEGLAAVWILASKGTDAVGVSKQMVLEMLLLLERLVAPLVGAFELPLVALEVPIELTLADKLLVRTFGALEL